MARPAECDKRFSTQLCALLLKVPPEGWLQILVLSLKIWPWIICHSWDAAGTICRMCIVNYVCIRVYNIHKLGSLGMPNKTQQKSTKQELTWAICQSLTPFWGCSQETKLKCFEHVPSMADNSSRFECTCHSDGSSCHRFFFRSVFVSILVVEYWLQQHPFWNLCVYPFKDNNVRNE